MNLSDKKYETINIKGTWNSPYHEEEKILSLNTEIDKLNRFQKETPSAPPVNHRRKPSSKKERPKWLLLNETPYNVKKIR